MDRLLSALNTIFIDPTLPVSKVEQRTQLVTLIQNMMVRNPDMDDVKIECLEVLPKMYLSPVLYHTMLDSNWGETLPVQYQEILDILDDEWINICTEIYVSLQ
jgi:hypothetical protein